MYAWIWRHLPFGLAGKVAGSALIVVMLSTVAWLWVFPWLEPLLPFDDVRLEPGGVDSRPASTTTVQPSGDPTDDPFFVPYSTVSNDPVPSLTPTSS